MAAHRQYVSEIDPGQNLSAHIPPDGINVIVSLAREQVRVPIETLVDNFDCDLVYASTLEVIPDRTRKVRPVPVSWVVSSGGKEGREDGFSVV